MLELLGCVATGPTTEEALSRAPGVIGDYLRFLERHGEIMGVNTEVETEVAEHITEGVWLGNGDPSILFQPDLEPLTPEDAEVFIHRSLGMQAEVDSLVGGLSEEEWEREPQPSGRSIQAILEHVLESEYAYMRAFGKLEGLPGLGSIATKREGDLLGWTAHVRGRVMLIRFVPSAVKSAQSSSSTGSSLGLPARSCAGCWSTNGSTWRSCGNAWAGRSSPSAT